MPDSTVTRNSGDGDAFFVLGGRYEIKVSSEESDGKMTVIEMHVPPDTGPPPHTHDGTETVYVLEGAIKYHIGGETFEGRRGALFHIPAGVVENFEPTEETRLLVTYSPGGIEGFFHEIGVPATSDGLPPPPEGPPDVEQLVAAGAKYGVHIQAPPG